MTIWNAIQYVTTPLSLIAFLAAAVAYVYRAKLKEQMDFIKRVPDKDLPDVLDKTLDAYKLKRDNLTRDQKYNLMIRVLEDRIRRMKIIAYTSVVCLVIAASTVVTAIAFGTNKGDNPGHPTPTPSLEEDFTFDFNPPSPFTLTGDKIEITVSLKDKNSNSLKAPISWGLIDDSDAKYVSVDQEGNTARITRKPEANRASSDEQPLVIRLFVSAKEPGNEQEEVTDEVNLIVKPSGTSGVPGQSSSLPFESPRSLKESASVITASLEYPLFRASQSTPTGDGGLASLGPYSELAPSTNYVMAAPVVFIIDNGYRVYSQLTLHNRETNAHDINSIIKDLNIDARVEPVSPNWERADAVVKANPALIIIHWHSFCFNSNPGGCNPRSDGFLPFLSYVAGQNENVHFLVYSRSQRITEKEPSGQRRFLIPLNYARLTNIPSLRDRIHPFYVQTAPNAFCDAATSLKLKAEIRRLLNLR